jgi:hypothetical protein
MPRASSRWMDVCIWTTTFGYGRGIRAAIGPATRWSSRRPIPTASGWTSSDFHSDALRVVERFTFVSPESIRYEATIEDPKVFTAPWKMALTVRRNKEPGFELWEDACVEGQDASTGMFQAVERAKSAR